MSVCKSEDDFVYEQKFHQARWMAVLSNGETIIQDDGRPGQPENAWLRLKKYVYDNDLKIENIILQWRHEKVYPFEPNQEGYHFSMGLLQQPGGQPTRYFVLGHLKDNKVYIQKWRLPDLKVEEKAEREPNEYCLIRNVR